MPGVHDELLIDGARGAPFMGATGRSECSNFVHRAPAIPMLTSITL
jgi:hypothetical protein